MDSMANLFFRPIPNPQTEGDIFENRHVAKEREMLKNEADVSFAGRVMRHLVVEIVHAAGIGHFEPRNDAQQSRLAAA